MSAKRMTANPLKPARYCPGKPVAEEPSSDEEDSQEGDQEEHAAPPTRAPPPKVSSFPADTSKLTGNLKQVDLNKSKGVPVTRDVPRPPVTEAEKAINEDDFETEESENEASSASEPDSDEESDDSESSSEDEAPKKLLRPTFIKKDQRNQASAHKDSKTEDDLWAEEEARKREKADALIQEQLEKDRAARAAGKKDWDDDDVQDMDDVDDTDGLDPETERAEWKLRELKRIKRDREAIEVAEKEREEIERRRNLTKEERDAEDKEFLQQQKEDREGRGKMGYMQKYFHKGAFFQDDSKEAGLDQRDIMGSRFQDDMNREILPEYMQIRDMSKLGKKGRTKYRDLKSEDTGRWGMYDDHRRGKRQDDTVDDIFKADRDHGGKEVSGANTIRVGERRRAPEGAPEGPRQDHEPTARDSRGFGGRDDRGEQRRRSPPRRRRSESRSRSPARRKRYSRSRSRSPPRHHDRPDRDSERKRASSPYDRDADYKRRRVESRY